MDRPIVKGRGRGVPAIRSTDLGSLDPSKPPGRTKLFAALGRALGGELMGHRPTDTSEAESGAADKAPIGRREPRMVRRRHVLRPFAAIGAAVCAAVLGAGEASAAGWVIQPTPPNPTGITFANLQAVACPSATACTAVGGYGNSSNGYTLAERWNGV